VNGEAAFSYQHSALVTAAQPRWLADCRKLTANKGVCNESTGVSKKGLPQLQDHPPQRRGARDLQGSAPQAASRVIPVWRYLLI
jgi:hypothetical protein